MKKYVIIGNAESVHLVKWIRELISYFDVYVISSKNAHDEVKSMVGDSKIFNLNLTVSGEGGNWGLLKKYYRIKQILKAIEPEFVNAHYISSHGFIAAMIKRNTGMRFTLIQSAWGSDVLVSPFRNKMYYHSTRFSLNAGDLITSDSQHMTEVIKTLTNTPVMTFAFGLDHLPDVRLENKVENLYYSNRSLTENYNIGQVIQFFHKIVAADQCARLIISNDGSLRKELGQLVRDLELENHVSFKGFVSQKEQNAYYEESQFYISIPQSDATSVSLLEAMAYGCIPVVSDIPANHEWVTDRENGLYYSEETDVSQIQEVLLMKQAIFNKNRMIIQKRAIFPDAVKKYVNEIANLKEVNTT